MAANVLPALRRQGIEKQKMNKAQMFNRITTAKYLHVSRYFGNAMLYAVVGSSKVFTNETNI